MRMMMNRRPFFVFYLSLITCNLINTHGDIGDDNDPGTDGGISVILLQAQYPQSISDFGSGSTDQSVSDITITTFSTVVNSINNTSNNNYSVTLSDTSGADSTLSTFLSTDMTSSSPRSDFYHEHCNDSSYIWIPHNNTCIPKSEARQSAVDTIRRNSSSSDEKADALIQYFRAADNLTTESNIPFTLTPREIDELVDRLDEIRTRNYSTFLFVSQSTSNGSIGIASKFNSTKDIIKNTTKMRIVNSPLSAAAVISDQSIENITNIKMLIVDEPTVYKNFNPSDDQFLVSSVIIAGVNRIDEGSVINVSLYFQVLDESNSARKGRYSCSFLDLDTSTWNESGCTEPSYNETFSRYECTCNHLTTFALIWLPDTPQTDYLTAQDIASLVFLSISIVCFIGVIIHNLITRYRNPAVSSFNARELLPLISSASTSILFVFFIALAMTVYTRAPPSSPSSLQCFTSASVLMFFVYFFLIFMFCVKTSVGYFNYLRSVHLFPEPSVRKLLLLLIISFFVAITWTSFAAGFNSNSSFNITQLHGNKLCWFTRDVIHYFMTIPAGIFLFLNFITIVFVVKRILDHVRNATSPHQSFERMKRCVLVLLSSCVTQGIGWLFGPFISFSKSDAANVFGWVFVILNGLEGLWTILLYIIIRSQYMDESRRVAYNRKRSKKTPSTSNNILARRFRMSSGSGANGKVVFSDLYNEESIDWETNTCEA